MIDNGKRNGEDDQVILSKQNEMTDWVQVYDQGIMAGKILKNDSSFRKAFDKIKFARKSELLWARGSSTTSGK